MMNRLRAVVLASGVPLLLAACVSQGAYNAEAQQADTYQRLNAQLGAEVRAEQAQVAQLQNLIRVTLADGVLFPEGGVQLNRSGEATLTRLAPVLRGLSGQKVEVRGFTDNVPIGPELRSRYPTNLALSKARADQVVRFLAAQGVPLNLMAASGFGDTQPLASNDTAQGRARNRRVEIDIVPMP
jgi:chemotaxis protein MotB